MKCMKWEQKDKEQNKINNKKNDNNNESPRKGKKANVIKYKSLLVVGIFFLFSFN